MFCFNLNKLTHRGKDYQGFLLHFDVNNFHWDLNFRGDAPLMQHMTNGKKHVLQIDGDLFYPTSVVITSDSEIKDEEGYDSYIFPIDEGIRLINIMLYEDMELEYDNGETENDSSDDYDVSYSGEKHQAFQLLQQKIEKYEEIFAEDIIQL